jgi:hypothetical protein
MTYEAICELDHGYNTRGISQIWLHVQEESRKI